MEWASQFKGKQKKLTVLLKVIADSKLFMWSGHFDSSESIIGINFLDFSTVLDKILQELILQKLESEVNGQKYRLFYYRVDGLCPKWVIFSDSIPHAIAKKHKTFPMQKSLGVMA